MNRIETTFFLAASSLERTLSQGTVGCGGDGEDGDMQEAVDDAIGRQLERRPPPEMKRTELPVQAAAGTEITYEGKQMEAVFEGVHDFVLRDLSTLPYHSGAVVKSPRFELGGHSWTIIVFLGGKNEKSHGSAAVFLTPDPPNTETIFVAIAFQILAGAEAPLSSMLVPIWRAYGTPGEIPPGKCRGWRKTLTRADLIRMSRGDAITIRLTMRLLTEKSRPAPMTMSTLSRDLASLLESGANADVVFVADGGRTFRAHRAILGARSPVLRAMFDGRFKEGAATITDPIAIPDIDPETLAQLLRYLYSGCVDDSVVSIDSWTSLLVAADRFGVLDLFALSQHKISLLLSTNNVCSCLALAARFPSAVPLKEAVFDFLVKHQLPSEELDKLDGDSLRELVRRNARLVLVKSVPERPPRLSQSGDEFAEEESFVESEEEDSGEKKRKFEGTSPVQHKRRK